MEARHAQIKSVLNHTLNSAMHKLPRLPMGQIHTSPTRAMGLFDCLASSVYQGKNWRWQLETIGKIYHHCCPELVFTAQHVGQPEPVPKPEKRKIRVGFLAELLTGAHSVGKVIGPTISLLDQDKFEVFVFTKSGHEEDPKTKLFTQHAQQHLRLPVDGRVAREMVAR